MVASPFIIQELCGILRNEVVLITKVGRVDWSGGGDFCGNSGIGTNAKNATSCGNAFVTNIVLARALGLSVAREKAPSRAREKRPPEWESTTPEEKRVQERGGDFT